MQMKYVVILYLYSVYLLPCGCLKKCITKTDPVHNEMKTLLYHSPLDHVIVNITITRTVISPTSTVPFKDGRHR